MEGVAGWASLDLQGKRVEGPEPLGMLGLRMEGHVT